MKRFIKLTISSTRLAVYVDHTTISSIYRTNPTTPNASVLLTNTITYALVETPDEVMVLIEAATTPRYEG